MWNADVALKAGARDSGDGRAHLWRRSARRPRAAAAAAWPLRRRCAAGFSGLGVCCVGLARQLDRPWEAPPAKQAVQVAARGRGGSCSVKGTGLGAGCCTLLQRSPLCAPESRGHVEAPIDSRGPLIGAGTGCLGTAHEAAACQAGTRGPNPPGSAPTPTCARLETPPRCRWAPPS